MRCPHCESFVVFRFFDAYGQRRIFCRNCKGSFLDDSLALLGGMKSQKSLLHFKPEIYWKPEAVRQTVG